MGATIDEASSQFLQAAAVDLQRQLSFAGSVESVSSETTSLGTTLSATILIAERRNRVTGSGDSVLTAYADLRRSVGESTLVTAFQALVDR